MQFLNDIIKSRHGFKATQKFQSFIVLIKTLNLMMSFKNCIRIRIAVFWRHDQGFMITLPKKFSEIFLLKLSYKSFCVKFIAFLRRNVFFPPVRIVLKVLKLILIKFLKKKYFHQHFNLS